MDRTHVFRVQRCHENRLLYSVDRYGQVAKYRGYDGIHDLGRRNQVCGRQEREREVLGCRRHGGGQARDYGVCGFPQKTLEIPEIGCLDPERRASRGPARHRKDAPSQGLRR